MKPGGIVCLDLATVTGWSFVEAPGNRPLYGSRRNGGRPGASPGAVLDDFEHWLSAQLDFVQPAWIFYEAPYLAGAKTINPATVQVLYGLSAITLMHAHRRDIAIQSVNISRVTKHFTGQSWTRQGRAAKKAATMRMCQLFGWEVASDDESDALALLVYAESIVAPHIQRSSGPLWGRAAALQEKTQ